MMPFQEISRIYLKLDFEINHKKLVGPLKFSYIEVFPRYIGFMTYLQVVHSSTSLIIPSFPQTDFTQG